MKTLDPSFIIPPEVQILARQEAHRLGFGTFHELVSKEGEKSFRWCNSKPSVAAMNGSDRCAIVIPWETFLIITAANILNPPRPSIENLPILIRGAIYASDNGRLICFDCAGNAAKYTGYDISGQHVTRVLIAEAIKWKKQFGTNIACECGKTTPYPQLSP